MGFRPSASELVTKIKRAAADFIDLCAGSRAEMVDGVRVEVIDGEILRLWERAIDDIETAAMYAVKAATKTEL